MIYLCTGNGKAGYSHNSCRMFDWIWHCCISWCSLDWKTGCWNSCCTTQDCPNPSQVKCAWYGCPYVMKILLSIFSNQDWLTCIDRTTYLYLTNVRLQFSFWAHMLLLWVSGIIPGAFKWNYEDEASPQAASCWRHRRSNPGAWLWLECESCYQTMLSSTVGYLLY